MIRKIKWVPVIILSVVLTLVIGGGVLLFLNRDYLFSKKTEIKYKVSKKLTSAKEAIDYEAKIFMVGDSLIHGGVYTDARQDIVR